MQTFRYQARTVDGERVDGMVSAVSLEEATAVVTGDGKELVFLEQQVGGNDFGRGGVDEKNSLENLDTKEGVIFSAVSQPSVSRANNFLGEEMSALLNGVQQFLEGNAELVSTETAKEIRLQMQKLGYLLEHPNENIWRKQQRILARIMRRAEKEVNRSELRRWEEFGVESDKEPNAMRQGTLIDRLASLFRKTPSVPTSKMNMTWVDEKEEEDVEEAGGIVFAPESVRSVMDTSVDSAGEVGEYEESEAVKGIRYWYRVINSPNAEKNEEIFMKARYEAVWQELQRFIGVLLGFYLLAYFAAYYFLQTGSEDSFLVKIYSAPLFKQLVIVLFVVYGLLTLRRHFLKNHLLVDGGLFIVWVAVLWVLVVS